MKLRRDGITYLEGESIKPCLALKVRVEAYAGKVIEVMSFQVGQNPADLVGMLGGRLHYESLGEMVKEDGSIFVHADSDFDILLPQYTSPRRDRFTIAHELGHYFLHSNQGDKPIVAYRQGSSRIEWEANWFAAALLMPEEEFRQALEEYDNNIILVAERFGVSTDAAEVRKKALLGD